MSRIAHRLTGFSAADFLEATLPATSSSADVTYVNGVDNRQSVRMFIRLIVGPEDLNQERKEIAKHVPIALRQKK